MKHRKWILFILSLFIIILLAKIMWRPSKLFVADLKDINSILFTQMKHGLCIERWSVTDKGEISTILASLKKAKRTNKSSVSDTPKVDSFILVEFNKVGGGRLSIYKKNGKYYIDQPYEGVFLLDKNAMEKIGNTYQQGKHNTINLPFSPEIIELAYYKPIIKGDMMINSKVQIDYESNEYVVFHGNIGLFIYDLNKGKIIGELDLESIGCDNGTFVFSEEKFIVTFWPKDQKEVMFQYDIEKQTLIRIHYKKIDEQHKTIQGTIEEGIPSNVDNLVYIINDKKYTLFKNYSF